MNTFPYRTVLETRLGHDLGHVSAAHDPAACQALGVAAFTSADGVFFASATPSLQVAAHEAAHALGVRGEALAAQIAGEVTAGRSAARLLARVDPAPPAAGEVRPYTEIDAKTVTAAKQYDAGLNVTMRVSDDGHMALPEGYRNVFYATKAHVDNSAKILLAKKSPIKLSTSTKTITGKSPVGDEARTLLRVYAENETQSAADHNANGMKQWADCGRAARSLMGPNDANPHAKYKDKTGNDKTTSNSGAPRDYWNQIKSNTGVDENMTPEQAKKHGLNEYAEPGVGEAYVILPQNRNLPYNFHWGGVFMESGHDRATLENTAQGGYSAKDTRWFYSMYGPASKKQSFHEYWKDRYYGKGSVTMHAKL